MHFNLRCGIPALLITIIVILTTSTCCYYYQYRTKIVAVARGANNRKEIFYVMPIYIEISLGSKIDRPDTLCAFMLGMRQWAQIYLHTALTNIIIIKAIVCI